MAIVAWIDEPNTASVRVAEKAGLRAQGLRADPSDGVRRLLYADRPVG